MAEEFDGTLVAELFEAAQVSSVLSTPVLLPDGTACGFLRLHAASPDAFGSESLALACAAARHLGDAFSRSLRSAALARAIDRADAIVESAPEAILVVDQDGLIRSLNEAAVRILGASRQDAIGAEAARFVDDAIAVGRDVDPDEDVAVAIAASPALPQRDAKVENVARRACGAAFPAEIHLQRIPNGESVLRIRDVSSSRQSEVRTCEADRLAVIGTLAAGLGHDMNNMLCPIQAHLNALAKPQARRRADREPHVEGIRSGIAYLQRLADSLHALALDPDRSDDDDDSVIRLGQWWDEVGALLAKGLHGRAEFEARIDDDLPPVRVAGHSLTRAVLNLLVNAAEAMPAGRPRELSRVLFRVATASAGASVGIEVVDNGTGMSEEVRRRAFDMFFTTKVRGVGTGLGLPLVRRVVERAGGRVEIDSHLGAGTTVRLLLPVVVEPVETRRSPRALVLIADGRLRALVEMLLGRHDVEVHFEGTGVDFDLWIAGSESIDARQVADWCSTHPVERLVVVARSPASARRYATMGIPVVRDRNDLHAIGRALDRAIQLQVNADKEHT